MTEAAIVIGLVLALILQHLQWERDVTLEMLDRMRFLNLLAQLDALTDLAEVLHDGCSDRLTPPARHAVANAIGLARQVVATKTSGPEVRIQAVPGMTWPYDREGKVQL